MSDFLQVAETIQQLIAGINNGTTVMFCGAGISRNSGLPVVDQLVPTILRKLCLSDEEIQLINKSTLPFELFMETLIENSVADKILDIYDHGEPNTNHLLLAKLVIAGKLKTIISTNFDRLIERALELEGWFADRHYDVICKEEDFGEINWDEERARLIKIHGSVDDQEEHGGHRKTSCESDIRRAEIKSPGTTADGS